MFETTLKEKSLLLQQNPISSVTPMNRHLMVRSGVVAPMLSETEMAEIPGLLPLFYAARALSLAIIDTLSVWMGGHPDDIDPDRNDIRSVADRIAEAGKAQAASDRHRDAMLRDEMETEF